MASRTSAALEIRKLRKKLRQIENLERKDGDLLDEELLKISKKRSIRDNLLRLLATTEDVEESFEASTQSNVTNNSDDSKEPPDPDMCTNVTLVTPEDVEDDSYVDVEGLEVEISEEISTPDRTEDNIPVEKEVSTDDACLEQNQTKLTPERETEIERNNPYHVSQRTPLRGDNVSDSQNQQKEKTKSKQSKKSHSQLDTENTPSVFDLSNWRNSAFYVTELEGHNDLITSSDIQGTMLVTASRDTTVKVWDMKEMREVRSLGGHTGGVNAVVLIPTSSSNNICKKAGFPSTKGQLILSGSSDCSFKLWCSATGEVRRSTYTFSPVTCVGYHNSASIIITGSDGGKLETWDVQSSKSLQSLRAFADSVSGIQIHETHVFVSSLDGIIKVYEVNGQQLQCVFESEGTRSTDGSALCCRGIRGMTISNGLVYYGDDGPNVKALNWKSGLVHKLGNHNEEFGITDSLACCEGLLLASAFCLDKGLGYINVRSAEGEKYFCSLDDGETDRIMSICSSKLSDSWVIISAGVQLKVWNQTSNARYIRPDARRVKPSYYLGLTKSPRHSDVESDLESSESESELESDDLIDDEPGAPSPSWKSWCVVM